MAKFREVEYKVLRVLNENKKARSDDFILIHDVLSEYVDNDHSLSYVLLNHKELGIPSLESITRTRRRLQVEKPELRDPKSKYIRQEEEIEYRNEYKR